MTIIISQANGYSCHPRVTSQGPLWPAGYKFDLLFITPWLRGSKHFVVICLAFAMGFISIDISEGFTDLL